MFPSPKWLLQSLSDEVALLATQGTRAKNLRQ